MYVFDVRTTPLGEEGLLLPHATKVFFLIELSSFLYELLFIRYPVAQVQYSIHDIQETVCNLGGKHGRYTTVAGNQFSGVVSLIELLLK